MRRAAKVDGMTAYTFTVAGTPKGKGRPRFAGNRAYTPPTTKAAEAHIMLAAQAAGVRPIAGPVRCEIIAVAAIPPSWSKKRRAAALIVAHDTRKPDGDNIAKLVGDALNGIAWHDDAQVSDWIVRKRLAQDGRPFMTVRITALQEDAT